MNDSVVLWLRKRGLRLLAGGVIFGLLALNALLIWQRQDITPVAKDIPKYHFYVIFQNSVDPFWDEVRRGVEDAARQYGAAVEFQAPRFNNWSEEGQYLDIATLSGVDGIITHAANDPLFIELINKADDQGIPVVTIENDAKDSRRRTFVGSDSSVLGRQAGDLINEATGGQAKIAVIMSSDSQKDSVTQNVIVDGFLRSLGDKPGMEVEKIYTSKLGILSAEEITRSIINTKDVNAIFCVDTVDTIGVAQTLVDFNKVGEMTVVGYGVTSEIIRYIDKGVLYGTVMGDPYRIGYESLRSLVQIKENQETPDFVDTGVNFITRSNLQMYTK